VFATDGAADVQIAFLVDGRPSAPHETAFAAAEGARKIGIVRRLRQSGPFEAARELLPADLLRGATDSSEAHQLRDAAATFSRIAEEEREKLLTSDDELERETARDRLESVESRLSEISGELASLPARQVEVFEHPHLLRQALQEATNRILIVSPWIRAGVVDDEFLSLLRAALNRGVSVSIGYGLGDEWVHPRDAAARDRLHDLAAEFANLSINELGDTHAKVLILDSRFVVVTSFNWLSFKGDPNKPFRDERGMLVTVPELIEQLYSDLAERISATTG
jgi:phosphatidylserine/phosphatidylglycerophosphate/cardiolipin synthase-like enzyme